MSTMSAVAIRDDQIQFDDLQRKALAHMGVDGAGNADLAIFMHHCKRTGLDPFTGQIHMIGRNTYDQRSKRWQTKFTIQTGIDGYRLIARRAAGAAGYGYEDTQWRGRDGQWHDCWDDDENPPVACRVVVVRDGQRFPAVARYKSYVQTKKDGDPNHIWASRPAEQLEKCTEALALRKAFPQDLSGLRTTEEMGQADNDPPATMQSPQVTMDDFRPVADEALDAEVVHDEDEFTDTLPADGGAS